MGYCCRIFTPAQPVYPIATEGFCLRCSQAIDRRTTRQPGYAISQIKRKRVEEIFGWFKTVAGLRKTRHRGADRVGWMFTFAAAVYNLVRMRTVVRKNSTTVRQHRPRGCTRGEVRSLPGRSPLDMLGRNDAFGVGAGRGR